MRRKKLANKIVSILMAGLMVASTPMSALATDVELTDGIQQIEVQSASEDSETAVEEDSLTDETAEGAEDEDLAGDEEITVEEDVTADEVAEYGDESGEEVILGEEEVTSGEELTDEAALLADVGTQAEVQDYLRKITIDVNNEAEMIASHQYQYTLPASKSIGTIDIGIYANSKKNIAVSWCKSENKNIPLGSVTSKKGFIMNHDNISAEGFWDNNLTDRVLKITIGTTEEDQQEYTFTLKRSIALGEPQIVNANGESLKNAGEVYYLPEKDTPSIGVTVNGYGANLKINGESAIENKKKELPVQFDENGEFKLTVEASYGDLDPVTKTYTIKKLEENAPITGKCGEQASWELLNGVLTIKGSGNIQDYTGGLQDQTWKNFIDSIKKIVVEDGITKIGRSAFYKCDGNYHSKFCERNKCFCILWVFIIEEDYIASRVDGYSRKYVVRL